MPDLNDSNVRHLLRRTEFVDRQERVDALLDLGTIEAAVDNVMAVDTNPPSVSFSGIPAEQTWERGVRLGEFWLDRMANATKPFGERMALFWHGHICTDLAKARSADEMSKQIDLFRREGLGSDDSFTIDRLMSNMARQTAMLRYLDNEKNFKNSPNQNFARELMELFLLGVGNYTEVDVEASTAAWTGHGVWNYDTGGYRFNLDRHERSAQTFLGKQINVQSYTAAFANSGNETIEVILGTKSLGGRATPIGSGKVPLEAEIVENRDRPTQDVAAEFLSKKLWQEFGEADSGGVPPGVLGAMTTALKSNGFAIRPWVRAMLIHDDFYADETKDGLVRQPIEYAVALMVATKLPASKAAQLWLLERAGQRPLFPPNVSGWKPNGYWVNASAMGARNEIAQGCRWRLTENSWDGDGGYIRLRNGNYNKSQLKNDSSSQVVDNLLALMDLELAADARNRIAAHLDSIDWWQRLDALLLILLAPEMHAA